MKIYRNKTIKEVKQLIDTYQEGIELRDTVNKTLKKLVEVQTLNLEAVAIKLKNAQKELNEVQAQAKAKEFESAGVIKQMVDEINTLNLKLNEKQAQIDKLTSKMDADKKSAPKTPSKAD